MADQYTISAANLSIIERNLGAIHQDLEVIDSGVGTVNNNVKVVYSEIEALAQEFHDFVQIQVKANAKSNAQQQLIRIRQEMEKKFGHYDIVRRTTTGIPRIVVT